MKSRSNAPSHAPGLPAPALPTAEAAPRVLRAAVFFCALALPMLAAAAPALTTHIGLSGVGSSTCLRDVNQTAGAGPLVDSQFCAKDFLGPQSAAAFVTADFGSLGASMVLNMSPLRFNTPSITGAADASFQAEYIFSGPGTSVPVQLNLDLDGLLSASGERSRAFMQIVLDVAGVGPRTARIDIRDNGQILIDRSLDADIDIIRIAGYSSLPYIAMQHKGIGSRAGGRNILGRNKYQRCRLAIVMAGTKAVVVEDTETDLCVGIGRAADRARCFVADRFNRQRAESPRVLASTTRADPVFLPRRVNPGEES